MIIVTFIDLENRILDTNQFYNSEQLDLLFKNLSYWNQILDTNNNYDLLKQKGIFFMCSHLFRMIPYQYKISLNNAIFCICQIIIWINQI